MSCASLSWAHQCDSYRILDAKILLKISDVFFSRWLKCALTSSKSFLQRTKPPKRHESARCVACFSPSTEITPGFVALIPCPGDPGPLSPNDGGGLCPEQLLCRHLEFSLTSLATILIPFSSCSLGISLFCDISQPALGGRVFRCLLVVSSTLFGCFLSCFYTLYIPWVCILSPEEK